MEFDWDAFYEKVDREVIEPRGLSVQERSDRLKKLCVSDRGPNHPPLNGPADFFEMERFAHGLERLLESRFNDSVVAVEVVAYCPSCGHVNRLKEEVHDTVIIRSSGTCEECGRTYSGPVRKIK